MKQEPLAQYESKDGKFRFEFFQEKGFVVIRHYGDVVLEDAKVLSDTYFDLHRRFGRKFKVLMPLDEFQSADAETRKHMGDTVLGENSPVSRFAVYGGSPQMRAMMNMHARTVTNTLFCVFATRDAAEEWLLNDTEEPRS